MQEQLAAGVRHVVRTGGSVATTLALSVFVWACGDSPSPTSLRQSDARPNASEASSAQSEVIPGQYIITFADSVNDVPGLAKKLANQYGASPMFTYASAIKGFAAKLPDQAVKALQNNPQIESIEQDAFAHLEGSGVQTSPSWNLDRIDQQFMPLDGSYAFSTDGSGVNVYIVDTGIRTTHAEFSGRAFGAYSAISDGQGSDDCNGHGTHVAGIVGAKTYGVAKGARLFAVRVMDCSGNGSYSQIISGVDWITKNRVLPAVANMSLSGSKSSALNTAVENSIAAGIVYAVAAANYSADACNYSPASAPHALTTAASTRDITSTYDTQASYSDYGPCVDLFAPGSAIKGPYNTSDTATAVGSGTSAASPHVAGVAALYLSANPMATPSQVASAIVGGATVNVISGVTPGTVNLLLNSNVIKSSPGPATGGAGDTTTSIPAQPTSTPVASFSANGCPKNVCTFDGSSSTATNGISSFTWSFGDGSSTITATTTGSKTTHTYSGKGNYLVTLTVTDKAGLSSSISHTVSIKK